MMKLNKIGVAAFVNVSVEKLRNQIKQSFSFQKGFEEKRFHKFKIKELKTLKKIWADETI